jgi:type 1 fimbria pilin
MSRSRLVVAVAATAFLAVSAVPAFGADTGTVNAQVTVASPCITVSPGQIDFPTAAFGTNVAGNSAQQISVTNCSSASERIFARGSDATSTTSGALWSLISSSFSCPGSNDLYGLALTRADSGVRTDLQSGIQLIDPAHTAGATVEWGPSISLPCSGSSGAGETMAMQFVFVAAF